MRLLVLAPLLTTVACAADGDYSIAADHDTCRGRGLAAGTDAYATCVKQVSDERLRWWESFRVDMSH